MAKNIIVANWKMNPQKLSEAKKLFSAVLKTAPSAENTDIVICPPFVFLSDLITLYNFKTLKLGNLFFGAQNCFYESEGAYTGEISPVMLKNLGCRYVILGHSERRQFFGETDEIVNKKIKIALSVGLRPIFCIGEKEGEEMHLIVEQQLRASLADIGALQIRKIIIAYEPIWAIGTGRPCLPENALEITLLIRRILSQLYGRKIADKISILYGGSVDDKNDSDYIKIARMNGLLVGGASLDARVFGKIISAVKL